MGREQRSFPDRTFIDLTVTDENKFRLIDRLQDAIAGAEPKVVFPAAGGVGPGVVIDPAVGHAVDRLERNLFTHEAKQAALRQRRIRAFLAGRGCRQRQDEQRADHGASPASAGSAAFNMSWPRTIAGTSTRQVKAMNSRCWVASNCTEARHRLNTTSISAVRW